MPNQRDIIAFLKEAHVHGWPHGIAPTTKPELHGFQEVRFQRGPWAYLDLFGGALTDIGFEVVFHREKAVWGVSYRGGVINGNLDANEIFAFLLAALDAPNESALPLRGPEEYRSEDRKWLYRYRLHGEFRSFTAVEQILFESSLSYERVLLGGCFGDDQLYGPAIPLYTALFAPPGQ